MKLCKLTIDNIASIRHACIDFTAEPLASAPLYLISGITGAGKTTILDSICLALYGTTPRLNNHAKNGHNKDLIDGELTFTDPRAMVRRDAVEGAAVLEFIGNDSVSYIARWEAARPRRKSGKPLMKPSRSVEFKDAVGNTIVYDKLADIRTCILKSVGLDFEKFCRTTMLAQGDFTRFLFAKNEEKSEILERITGTEIYKKISIRIHEKFKARKDEAELLRKQTESTALLTDEEIARISGRIAELEAESKSLAAEKAAIEKKLTWISTLDRLNCSLDADKKQLQLAEARYNGEEVNRLIELISLYQRTEEPRRLTQENLRASHSIETAQGELKHLRDEYIELYSGVLFAHGRAESLRREQASLTDFINRQRYLQPVYDNARAIADKLSNHTKALSSIRTMQSQIEILEHKIATALTPQYSEAKDKLFKSTEAYKSLSGLISSLSYDFEARDISRLRSEKESLILLKSKIEQGNIIRRLQSDLQSKRMMLDANKKKLELTDEALKRASTIHEAAKARYEKEREAVGVVISQLRSSLTVGCECPLCRQRVAVLPIAAEINKLVENYKIELEKSSSEVERLRNEHNKLKALIETEINDIAGTVRRIPADFEMPSVTGEECETSLSKVNTAIAKAEKIEKELKEKRGEEERMRSEIERLTKAETAADSALKLARNDLRLKSENLDAMISDHHKLKREILSMTAEIGGEPFDNPQQFADKLLADAAGYAKALESIRNFETELAELETANQRDLANIMSIRQWPGLKPAKAVETTGLDRRIVELIAHVNVADNTITSATSTLKRNEAEINRWLDDENIDRELFRVICNVARQEIIRAQAEVKEASDSLVAAQTSLRNTEDALRTHYGVRPEIREEDTAGSLSESIDELGRRIDAANREIGVATQQIATDRKAREALRALLSKLEEKRAEVAKWKQLDDLFGDTNGKKFSMIAQSYVLMELIQSANKYMATLTDRYRLQVQPNSFVISVEDAYDGYKLRATNTISGGESFLVSLALALALSDIAEDLQVDTLFIDEGFGSLSGEALRDAVTTLQTLHSNTGRHVGIISHVDELREQIPVQIKVTRNSRTSISTVAVESFDL